MKRFAIWALVISFFLPLIAFGDTPHSITLGYGTWIVGEDIPAGHYKIDSDSWQAIMCDRITVSREADLNTSETVFYIDTKDEAVLLDGLYICISSGSVTFTKIDYTNAQLSNETFSNLLQMRLFAILGSYENAEQYRWGVYAGTYTVGVDIPEGSWQIRYFDILSDTITITHNGRKTRIVLVSPESSGYSPEMLTATYLPLYNGDTVTIDGSKSRGAVFFIPYSKSLDEWR